MVDAPGYGARGRPEWGELFDNYTTKRSAYENYLMYTAHAKLLTDFHRLRRIYILFNSKHGLNEMDRIMLRSLEEKCQDPGNARKWTLQAVITKADAIEGDALSVIRKIQKDIFDTAPLCLPGIVTAVSKRAQIGIDTVRYNMIEACGLLYVQSTVLRKSK